LKEVIVSMREYRSRETAAVLRHMLARVEAGECLQGMALCAKWDNEPEDILFTGLYRTSAAEAAKASMRMSSRLMQLQDELDTARA
jgi:hypothetical protein